jgi:tetratricopeptide (TPR) repeat protein
MSKRYPRPADSRKGTAPGANEATRPRFGIVPCAALLLATLIAYWPALQGGFLWDDDRHVTAPELQSLHGLWRIWFDLGATQQYYPVLHSTFWLEHQLWGDSVLGYHLVNVLLHAACACLLVAIVRRLSLPGAWLAGFVFALHPVCVEAVAWISEQKSTLSGMLCLSALLVYLRFDRLRGKGSYFLALLLFILALLSKSVTATLPAALLVIFWWRNGRLNWKRDVLPLVPWFVIALPMGLFTAWVERTYVGAAGRDFDLSFIERLLIAGRVLWFYCAKLILPVGLAFSYPRWRIDPAEWWQYLYPAGILILASFLVLVARRNRGPLASFLIYAGTLFPVLGFLNVLPFRYSWVADHFQYLASMGLIVPLAAFLTALAARRFPGESRPAAAAAAAVGVLFILTFRQSAIYRDEETLYRETLLRNPSSWMVHNNLGTVLESKPGRLMDAIAQFQAALKLEPVYAAQAHFNLAGAYAQLGSPGGIAQAIAEYRAGLRVKPDHVQAHINLGTLLARDPGRTADAIAEFQRATRLEPGSVEAHSDLGALLAQVPGRLSEAIDELETAVQLAPGLAELRCNLGHALLGVPGRLPDAIGQFNAALRINPDLVEAHFWLGTALSQLPGRTGEAIAEYRAALRIRPDFEPALQSLQELEAQR